MPLPWVPPREVVPYSVPLTSSRLAVGFAPSGASSERLWLWGRTAAWKCVKRVMRNAGIADGLCKPKALRHAFAVEAGQKGAPLNMVQRWLGHARIETTAIYASAIGDEERILARPEFTGIGATRIPTIHAGPMMLASGIIVPLHLVLKRGKGRCPHPSKLMAIVVRAIA